MKTIPVSARSKSLNELLRKARRTTVILESANGERFALTSVNNWEGFDVGAGEDFSLEVSRTGKNRKLMKHLAARRKNEKGPSVPLREVKKRIGLE